MKNFLFILISLFIFLSCDNRIKNIIDTENQNIYECDYKNTHRKFSLYYPDDLNNCNGLILMLHGYGETIISFKSKTKIEKIACKKNYIVCYVSSVPESGWNSGMGDSTKDDSGFIKNLAVYLQKKFNITKKKTYLVGFSNGAFMSGKMSLQKNSPFKSFVCVAGLPPLTVWEKEKNNISSNLFFIYGSKDNIVPKINKNKNQKYSFPFIEDVENLWCNKNKKTKIIKEKIGKDSYLKKHENQNKRLWILEVENGAHQWFEERTTGFEMNKIILDFFDSHL